MRHADLAKTQAPTAEQAYRLNQEDNQVQWAPCGQPGRPMSSAEILAELFTYHPPTSEQLPKYAALNQAAKNFAEVVLQTCPPSVDRSAAIRLIRDARMTANASVELNGLSL